MSCIVAVTGGREYADGAHVARVLDEVASTKGIKLLVHGDARGADTLARKWAESRGILHVAYPYIGELGRAGGAVRNRQMLRGARPDLLVAFPGGLGTEDCCRAALALGIEVMRAERRKRGSQ